MKKILHLSNNFLPYVQGGIENILSEISNSSNHRNDILTMHNIKIEKKNHKFNVFFAKKIFTFFKANISIDFVIKLFRIYKNYDYVVIHSPQPFIEILSLFLVKKKICFYHSDIIDQKKIYFFYSLIQKIFLKKCQKIITSSKQYLDSSKTLRSFKKKSIVWNLSISKKFNIKKYKKLPLPKKYFIFIGSNRSYKGFENLFAAFQDKHLSKISLLVIGNKFKNYQNTISTNNIFFLGNIKDEYKNYLLKNSISLILPSIKRSEAYGLVLIEALRVGTPIITTKIGTATSYINLHNKTGFNIRPNSKKELINSIKKFINMKKENYKLMEINSKKRFLHFCIENTITNYDKIFI